MREKWKLEGQEIHYSPVYTARLCFKKTKKIVMVGTWECERVRL
jgi:hypothetical protein